MRRHRNSLALFTLIVLIGHCAFWCQEASAYLDPGSGSYLFQLLIAAVLGGLFVLKTAWHRIAASLQRLFLRKPRQDRKPE